MRFIVITTEYMFPGEPEIINLLFFSGMEILHLRKPRVTEEEMRILLSQIDSQFHHHIVLHDHHALINDFDIKGLHLNRRLPLYDIDINSKFFISKSCHSINELNHIDNFDYVFLSPVFDSISKEGYRQAFSRKEFAEAFQKGIINKKVIALGGMNESTIPIIKQYGFGGVAVLGRLWGIMQQHDKKDILERFEILRNICSNKTGY